MTILIAGVIGWWVASIYMYNFIISQQQYSVYDLPLALPSTILDSKWRELYTFFDERRVLVSYDAISPLMIDALISAEDQDFWNNDGFDPRGIARSTVVTLRDRWENGFLGYSQGASTLTQQIIKNTVVGKEKKLTRKLHEIIHAWLLTYNTYAVNKQFFSGNSAKIWQKSKEDIITYYLNSTFFGNNAYGISEASRIYFDTTPTELTLQQVAVLAAIPKSPYYFDPYRYKDNIVGNRQISIDSKAPVSINQTEYGHLFTDMIVTGYSLPDTAQDITTLLPVFSGTTTDEEWATHHRFINYSPGRKDYVIQRLWQDKKITLDEALLAIVTPMEFHPKAEVVNSIQAPHFVHYIKEEILWLKDLGITEQELAQGWYTITTTLNLDTQQELERIVTSHNDSAYKLWATNRALLVTNTKNGEIIGYVWSKNYYNTAVDGQVDLIRRTRQVWSTLKPLIYAYGMSQYPLGLDTIIRDTKTNFGGYVPNNADGAFRGNIKLKNALAWSRNIPAIKMFNALWGTATFIPWFQSLGMKNLSSDGEYGLSMALGTAPISMIDLAQWYSHLSDQEHVGIIHGISKIIDSQGMIVYEHADKAYERKIPLGVARLITYITQTASFAPAYFRDTVNVPWCPSCASKTWTTNTKVKGKNVARDWWLVTYNPDIMVIARAGNTDASPLAKSAYGYNLNTLLRNDVIRYLKEQGLTSEDSDRSYPLDQTISRKWQGETYKYTINTTLPNTVRNKL